MKFIIPDKVYALFLISTGIAVFTYSARASGEIERIYPHIFSGLTIISLGCLVLFKSMKMKKKMILSSAVSAFTFMVIAVVSIFIWTLN